MKYLYRCFVFSYLLLFAGILISSLTLGFPLLVNTCLTILGLEEKSELILSIVHRIPVTLLYFIISVNISFAILAVWKEKNIISYLKKVFLYSKEAFTNLFRSLTVPEILILVIIPLVASIYFAATIPVSYDEAITYNYFTVKPFYYSMIFYPYPNNHVLHSIFTNLTEYIPFLNPLFCIRIPAIISSLLTWLIGYSFVKKYYNSHSALLVVGLMSAMYMSIYYSFMSRGYSFTVLAFVVCMYAAFNIINKGSRNKDWLFFIAAGVLGCYSIPSFLYPFATLNILILIYNYRNIKQQFVSNLVAGVLVVLLYSPIMIVDGIAALTSNQFVQSVDRIFIVENIHLFVRGMIASIAGIPFEAVILIFVPLIYAVWQKKWKYVLLWVVFIFAPFVLLLIHAVNPFYRTFLYYNFIIAFIMIIPFSGKLKVIPKYAVLLFVLCLQSIGVYSFSTKVSINEGFNTDVSTVVKTYFKDENEICFPCIASENYKFEAKVRGLEDRIDFKENEKANVDTISGYDYVILEKRRDQTIDRKPFATSSSQNIYKLER